MKAWQFTGVNKPLELVDLPDPVPGPGELVIDVKTTGLCHSDVSFMDGAITALLRHVPIVLGHEIAGVVSAVGTGVTEFAPGMRVGIPATVQSPGTASDGGFSEKVRVQADQCVPIPDNVPFDQATPAMCAGKTAYQAVVTVGKVEAGMNVGVIGYGGVGSLGAQIARALGASVYVADVVDGALESARAAGAAGASHDIRDFEAEGLDVIIDFAGYGTTTASAIDAIKPGGRVVQVGLATEMATISAQKVTMKEITYVGASNAGTREGREVLELMASGTIRSDVTAIGFEEIPECLEALARGGVRTRFIAVLP